EDCLKCHLPETLAALELQHKHPGKWRDERVECLLCHTAPQGARAQYLKMQEVDKLANLIRSERIRNKRK
ncbi:MAG: hypothetical protein L0220_26385, partial [Acidobacteria bacterium]|nr:hypothetical protein [Acidobacteriota bacterium]